jgi:hypothetical protein
MRNTHKFSPQKIHRGVKKPQSGLLTQVIKNLFSVLQRRTYTVAVLE